MLEFNFANEEKVSFSREFNFANEGEKFSRGNLISRMKDQFANFREIFFPRKFLTIKYFI